MGEGAVMDEEDMDRMFLAIGIGVLAVAAGVGFLLGRWLA